VEINLSSESYTQRITIKTRSPDRHTWICCSVRNISGTGNYYVKVSIYNYASGQRTGYYEGPIKKDKELEYVSGYKIVDGEPKRYFEKNPLFGNFIDQVLKKSGVADPRALRRDYP